MIAVHSSTNDAPPPVRDPDKAHPVAAAWRPALQSVVDAFVRADYALSAGVQNVDPVPTDVAAHIRDYIADYGEKLVPIPPETWQTSRAQWMGSHWDVIVDLWTDSEGRSDLVLSARVTESDGEHRIAIRLVYVP